MTETQYGPRLSFTLKEARLVTGLGRDTLLKAIKRKELDAVQRGPSGPGAKWFINAKSLERFVTPEPKHSGKES